MSAKAIKNTNRIGIIACGGDVPWHVAKACHDAGHDPFIIGLKSFTNKEKIKYYDHGWQRIGAIGKIIKALKSENVKDLCLIGSLGKPSLSTLRPDMTGLKFLSSIRYGDLGDDGLLRAIRGFLELKGFAIIGAHTLAPDLITPEGILTRAHPSNEHEDDINIGIKTAQDLGQRDKGQAVIISNGKITAREAREGTAALINTHGEKGAILVKLCKPHQDRDIDLPTIGMNTVKVCAEKEMAGIIIHAGESLFIDRDAAIALADTHDIFIKGIRV